MAGENTFAIKRMRKRIADDQRMICIRGLGWRMVCVRVRRV